MMFCCVDSTKFPSLSSVLSIGVGSPIPVPCGAPDCDPKQQGTVLLHSPRRSGCEDPRTDAGAPDEGNGGSGWSWRGSTIGWHSSPAPVAASAGISRWL